jgi:hypothetical protein
MESSAFKNSIRFAFMFHSQNGNSIESFDPGYILEKWKSHFGTAEPRSISAERHLNLRLRDPIYEWIQIWGEASYKVMSRYLSVIMEINGKSLYEESLPSDILGIMENSIDGLLDMELPEYRGLHSTLEREMQDWLASERVSKDLTQINRDISIRSLLR